MAGPFVLVSMPGPMVAIHAVFGAGQARRLWDGIPWWVVTAVALAEIGRRLAGLRLAVAVVALAVASYLFENQVARRAQLDRAGDDRRHGGVRDDGLDRAARPRRRPAAGAARRRWSRRCC